MWTADKIREFRKRIGETQEELARRLRVNMHTVRYWEQGRGTPIGPAEALLDRLEQDFRNGELEPLQAV